MSERAPYSRVYWSIVDDPKFVDVYDDDRKLALWLRLLMIADQAHPASPHVPLGIHRPSLTSLVTCGLVDLGTGNRYRIRGLDKERARRWGGRSGTDEPPTPDPNGTDKGPKPDQPVPSRAGDARDQTRRDETSKDETSTPRAGLSDEEAAIFSGIARIGAFIRPESAMGQRLIGLIARRGSEAVATELRRLARHGHMSDRQIVFGLEDALDKIPSSTQDERAADDQKLASKRQAKVDANRMEWFRNTGKWDDAWGERPSDAA